MACAAARRTPKSALVERFQQDGVEIRRLSACTSAADRRRNDPGVLIARAARARAPSPRWRAASRARRQARRGRPSADPAPCPTASTGTRPDRSPRRRARAAARIVGQSSVSRSWIGRQRRLACSAPSAVTVSSAQVRRRSSRPSAGPRSGADRLRRADLGQARARPTPRSPRRAPHAAAARPAAASDDGSLSGRGRARRTRACSVPAPARAAAAAEAARRSLIRCSANATGHQALTGWPEESSTAAASGSHAFRRTSANRPRRAASASGRDRPVLVVGRQRRDRPLLDVRGRHRADRAARRSCRRSGRALRRLGRARRGSASCSAVVSAGHGGAIADQARARTPPSAGRPGSASVSVVCKRRDAVGQADAADRERGATPDPRLRIGHQLRADPASAADGGAAARLCPGRRHRGRRRPDGGGTRRIR